MSFCHCCFALTNRSPATPQNPAVLCPRVRRAFIQAQSDAAGLEGCLRLSFPEAMETEVPLSYLRGVYSPLVFALSSTPYTIYQCRWHFDAMEATKIAASKTDFDVLVKRRELFGLRICFVEWNQLSLTAVQRRANLALAHYYSSERLQASQLFAALQVALDRQYNAAAAAANVCCTYRSIGGALLQGTGRSGCLAHSVYGLG